MKPSTSTFFYSALIASIYVLVVISYFQPAPSAWQLPWPWIVFSFLWMAFFSSAFRILMAIQTLRFFDRN